MESNIITDINYQASISMRDDSKFNLNTDTLQEYIINAKKAIKNSESIPNENIFRFNNNHIDAKNNITNNNIIEQNQPVLLSQPQEGGNDKYANYVEESDSLSSLISNMTGGKSAHTATDKYDNMPLNYSETPDSIKSKKSVRTLKTNETISALDSLNSTTSAYDLKINFSDNSDKSSITYIDLDSSNVSSETSIKIKTNKKRITKINKILNHKRFND
jgi:hypothetical protein